MVLFGAPAHLLMPSAALASAVSAIILQSLCYHARKRFHRTRPPRLLRASISKSDSTVGRTNGEIGAHPRHSATFRHHFAARFGRRPQLLLPSGVSTDSPRPALTIDAQPAAGDPEPAACLRVLVAQDNAVNRQLAVRMLEYHGCRVAAVANGAQALALLAEQHFDLILMDTRMPVVDGLEAARAIRLRECETGGHIPIVALVTCAMPDDEARCLEAGMDGCLARPLTRENLFRAAELLTRPPAARAAAACQN